MIVHVEIHSFSTSTDGLFRIGTHRALYLSRNRQGVIGDQTIANRAIRESRINKGRRGE
jgi:hypothetical protein